MATENDNGRLNFGIGIDLDGLKRDSEEAARQFDGIAAEARAKGADIDRAFGTDAARGLDSLASTARRAIAEIGQSCAENESAIAALEEEYGRLGKAMGEAYRSGKDSDLGGLQERAAAVRAEISVRKELLSQLREQSDALEAEAAELDEACRQTDSLGEAHVSLRQRIRELQEQMAQMREQGIDETSEAYRELTAELGRLRDIQSDIQKQGSVLANDQAQFQGIISGLQGISGGYTAVSGAMSLFGAKNEDLNKIMAKAQSLMSITIGLQQVSQMLDKDSAFQLTTVAKVREWWNNLLDVGRGKTTANTAAVELNTAAQKGNAGAVRTAGTAQQMENVIAETGTVANIGLAGAFKMVGAAIKSVPVFGWIVTALTAIVTVATKFISKAREAKKATEEWYSSIADTVYKPVTAIESLAAKWQSLGDDMESKNRFIEENRKAFEDLGLAINDVREAEDLLSSEDHLNKFIDAQIKKAEATVLASQAEEDIKELIETRQELEEAEKTPTVTRITSGGQFGASTVYEIENPDIEKYKKQEKELTDRIRGTFKRMAEAEQEGSELMSEIGGKSMESAGEVIGGSIAALERDLKAQQDIMNSAVIGSEEFIEAQRKSAEIQEQLNAARGKASGAAKAQDQENKEVEKALAEEGQIMESLTKSNEKARIDQMEDGHDKRMERIDYDYREELAKIEGWEEKLRKVNETTGVATTQAGEGVEEWQVGLTAEQIEAVGEARTLAQDKHNQDIQALNEAEEAEEQRHAEEERKIFDDILAGVETYGQKRERLDRERNDRQTRIHEEYIEKEKALYDEEGNLREGVTDENLENLRRQENDALLEIDREFYEAENALAMEELEAGVEELRAAVEEAKEDLAAAKAEGGDSEKLAAAKKKLTTANKELKTATKSLRSEQQSQQSQQKKGDDQDRDSENALGKLGNAVGKCGDAFEEMGDAIGGSVGDAFTKIGQVTSAVGGFLNSIDQFVEVGIAGMKAAAEGGVSAIKTVESASTILAMIGAIMQIAQVIASLFGNGDDKKEEEIQALQERIDDLQWELDNAEAARVRDATGGALSVVSLMYQQALADAKAANREGQSYVSMLAEWTKAANKATAADAAHERTVEGIIKTYTNLGYTVDKAIGEDKYKAAGDAVRNYSEQLALMYEQYEKEQSKKKTDTDKLKEYEETMDEIAQSIVDTLNSAVEDIIGGSYEDIAKQLGDAFVEAFQAGEDAAEAWGDTVEDIVNDIVRQMLIQQWIEPKIADIFNKYMEKWFVNGEYQGNQAVIDSMNDFSEELNGAMGDFADAWAEISEAMGWMSDSTREAASSGIAAASQESIDELNGRMTSIQGHTYSINENVAVLAATSSLILQSVANIEDNTDRMLSSMQTVESGIREVSGSIDEVLLKGVKVK